MPDNIEAPSLRESLNSAVEEIVPEQPSVPEPAAPPEPVESAPTPSETTEQATERRARDEAGRFAKKAAEEAAQKPPEKAAQPSTTPAPEKPAAPSPASPKPPQSWKPEAREEWAKLPDRVRQEVLRREGEVQRALQESSEARQSYSKFKEVIAPYEQALRASNADPMRTVQGLLQTSYALQYGPKQTVAQMIGQMVQAYLPGREGLEMLDGILSGQAPREAQQQFRDPRVDELLAQVEQSKARQAQQFQQQANTMYAEISQEEFFEDVRLDMADVMELAVKRGLQMTPREAYNRAVAMHPEISRVVSQREAAKRAATPNGATQRAKLASSSVRSSPVTPPPGERAQGDLRSDLEAAMEQSLSRT